MDKRSVLDASAGVRKGEEIELRKLTEFLVQNLEGFLSIDEVKQFPGGFSNLTYLLKTNLGEFVLRRPPFGANIKSAHDMGREYKVMAALKPYYDKVPKPAIYCEDEEIIGAPFYMMERVSGVILRAKPPKGIELSTELMRTVSEATIDNLADLHLVDIESSGLISLGKPEGYVQRQVDGWIGRYYKAKTDELKEMDEVAEWMKSHILNETPPALIHNDYKYDNIVLDADDFSNVKAVLDWEMATVGDPLMDLGTTVAYWSEKGDHPAMTTFGLTAFDGNYTRAEVLERYSERTGRDTSGFLFYYVYASFKIGVIVQQIYARYKAGLTQDPRFADMIHLVKACAANASNAIKYGRINNFR